MFSSTRIMSSSTSRRFHRPSFALGWAVLLLLAMGCSRTADFTRVAPRGTGPQWQPLLEGVDFARSRAAEPVLQEVYALRLDLRAPGLRIVVSPSNGDQPGETTGMKASTYLKQAGCQLVFNATPFGPVRDVEGLPTDIVGLQVSDGELVSPPNAKFGALMIGPGNRAWIEDQAELVGADDPTSGALQAVGGFGVLLRAGANLHGSDPARHPRTAVGVSREGRYLYVILIDGRQPGYSIGCTLAETADWLLWAGAWDGLNLDGGGSTELVMRGTLGHPRILNRPIHKGIVGNERVNGNAVGIFAEPLK